METYSGEAHCYESAKLRALEAILASIGIEVKEDKNVIKVIQNGEDVATFSVSI